MQIPIFSIDISMNVQMYPDIYVNKIMIEAVQMLSTANRLLTGTPKKCYIQDKKGNIPRKIREIHLLEGEELKIGIFKTIEYYKFPYLPYNFRKAYLETHINHPWNIWARESKLNYYYLLDLVVELNAEWQYRFDKSVAHASYIVACNLPYIPVGKFKTISRTPFPICVPDKYILHPEDIEYAYQQYFIHEKQHIARWTKRSVPNWFYYI